MSEEKIQEMKQDLNLLDIEDVMKLTGWGETTVREIMTDEDFPTLKIGKKNQVSFEALKEYLRYRRIKRGE